MNRRAPQVSIEKDHPVAGRRQSPGQTQSRAGFAFPGAGTGDQDAAQAAPLAGKQDGRAQGLVGLPAGGIFFFANAWDNRQKRQIQVFLDVVTAADGVIQVVQEEDRAQPQEETQHEAHGQIHDLARADGIFRQHGLVQKPDVVDQRLLVEIDLLDAREDQIVNAPVFLDFAVQDRHLAGGLRQVQPFSLEIVNLGHQASFTLFLDRIGGLDPGDDVTGRRLDPLANFLDLGAHGDYSGMPVQVFKG